MDKFIALSQEERKAAFQEASDRRDISPIIIEKDFWVCWVLKHIFEHKKLAEHITFKGGTSLSKAYQLIDRFSEDIDLTISRDAPYIVESADPMEIGISRKERERRIDTLKKNAQLCVNEFFLMTLHKIFTEKLPDNWKLDLDPEDPDQQTILFYYPKVFTLHQEYIRPHVKLEFGARGEIEPRENKRIIPYVAETFQQLFNDPYSNVYVLAAERTFWEKATILHALHHNFKDRDRMSRHYYDTFIMEQKGIADAALQNPMLLEKVVKNKSIMFSDNKASYDTAKIGSLCLIPSTEIMTKLKQDYADMQEMFFAEAPEFEKMMDVLGQLEIRINTQHM
ncbi:MAG: nucleotidyl transferase AbiEii/AbiGii toxin family protein [Gammaproteobacteria bacterium]|jgi:hypothetical protein